MKRNQSDLNKLLEESIKEVKDLGITVGNISPTLEINNAVRQFGRCTKEPDIFIISISKYIKDYPKIALKEVLVHEVLHTVEGCFNHGSKWLNKAEMLNDRYGYNIKRTTSEKMNKAMSEEHTQRLERYAIECVDCGYTIYRQVQSKVIKKCHLYNCGKCNGKFKRIR